MVAKFVTIYINENLDTCSLNKNFVEKKKKKKSIQKHFILEENDRPLDKRL